MIDGKKNEPKRIDRWNDFDLDLVNNWTKNLLFEGPFCLDQDLELKPLEFFLIEFEDEAKKILEENGLYSEELIEAWRNPSNVKDFSRLYPQRKDSPSRFSPLLTSMSLQNVAYVFLCVHRVRRDILNGDARQTAIDMLRLCFATVSANLHEMIVRGIKAKTAPAKGGKAGKKKHGIIAAIEKIFKGQDAFSAWLYFAENHYGYEKALEIEGYKIFFRIDIRGLQQDRISKRDTYRRGMLFEIFQDDVKTERGIKLPTFRRYFSETRKKILSK